MSTATVRIAIVDDQALVRSGLQALLVRDARIEVVSCVSGGGELLQAMTRVPADVILADIRMPGMDGFALVAALREAGHGAPVLLLTTFDEEDLPLRAAQCGAAGFLLKDASPAELIDAIFRVQRGERVYSAVAPTAIRQRLHADLSGAPPPELEFGRRELAILRMLAGGYSNKEIARAVHLSEGTVKNYVSEILQKLGVRDRTRAALKAITGGWI